MPDPLAYTADVPDAFLAVWQEGDRWFWRYRDAAGRERRRGWRKSSAAARARCATDYKARVGRTAAPTVRWTPCTPETAQAHGEDAQAQDRAQKASATVASCVRAHRPETTARERGPAPLRVVPAPVERPRPEFWHALELRFGRPPQEDPAYKAFIKSLPCLGCGIEGYSDPHHEPQKGANAGAWTDRQCVPLCRRPDHVGCHDIRTDLLPGWERLRDLALAAVGRLNAIYDSAPLGPGRPRR